MEVLKGLYLSFRYPSDQYRRRPKELSRFVATWNELTDRTDAPGEILHFIVTRRKNQKWVTFNGDYQRLDSMPDDFLSPGEWTHLRAIYMDLLGADQIGSDNLAFDDRLVAEVAREFRRRANRTVAGALLFAAIMAKRKRGEWPNVKPKKDDDKGFGDIDKIAS